MREGNTYLSRIKLAYLALSNIDKDQLLSLEVFSSSLFELLYVGAVSQVEVYMKDRLELEVFDSEDNMVRYIKKFNSLNRKKRYIKYDNKKPITEKIKDRIQYTLDNNQTYHQFDIMFQYLESVSGFDRSRCSCFAEMTDIKENRNYIIHNDSIRDEKKLRIGPSQVLEVFKISETFIEEIETTFQEMGHKPLIDFHPDK